MERHVAESPLLHRLEPHAMPKPSLTPRNLLRHTAATLLVIGLLGGGAWWANEQIAEAVYDSQTRRLRTTAVLAAELVEPDGLEAIDGPEDMALPSYRRTQDQIERVQKSDPDIRYAYILRHVEGATWTFVVDADDVEEDENRDGRITPDELPTLPGRVLDASEFNEPLLAGLNAPATDLSPTPDPPWGVTVSGYAPLCPNAPSTDPCSKMLVGIDMKEATLVGYIDRLQQALYALAIALGLLLVVAANLYLRARDALARSVKLQKQLITAKLHLAKFVPDTVRRLIEDNPDDPRFEKVPRDLTVMFVDLAGYTRLTEIMPRAVMNHLIESYFSAFLDVIRAHGGDVNETAGDGLMALFMDDDPRQHALSAARCAQQIQKKTEELNHRFRGQFADVTINIGISTGTALVGSTRFEGAIGSRWTYTASGSVTNLAARLADFATGGAIVVTETTRERIGEEIPLTALGPQPLKNVAEPVPLYRCPSESDEPSPTRPLEPAAGEQKERDPSQEARV